MMGEDTEALIIRHYLAIVQDPRGYPAGGLEPAPPEGPAQPMVFSVVKADEHDAAMRGAVEAMRAAEERLIEIALDEYFVRDAASHDVQDVLQPVYDCLKCSGAWWEEPS